MKTGKFWLAASLAVATLSAATTVQAQTVYRIVGPDGKVSFSDKQPATPAQGKVVGTGTGAGGAASLGNLPAELRQVAGKFPVTLYTSSQCSPCDSGRALLNGRGVPFTERTVTTAEDNAYLERLTGDASLPYVTIGGQRLRGFAESEWTQYLDAAGYPQKSILPAGYKNAAATPLVAVAKAEPAKKAKEEVVAPPAPETLKTPDNPAGIKF